MLKKTNEVPDWAKLGPINLRNYDWRVILHGQTKQRGDDWPTLVLGGQHFQAWHEYFVRHLGGFPWAFKALIDRRIREMNVPDDRPQWFDPSFTPTPGYRPLLARSDDETYSPDHRQWMCEQFDHLLQDLRYGRLSLDSGEAGQAPAGTVFRIFDEAVRRHKRPFGVNDHGRELPYRG